MLRVRNSGRTTREKFQEGHTLHADEFELYPIDKAGEWNDQICVLGRKKNCTSQVSQQAYNSRVLAFKFTGY